MVKSVSREESEARKASCCHPIADLVDKQDSRRDDWLWSLCGHCGKFMGYRPKDCDKYHKKNRAALAAKGREELNDNTENEECLFDTK